MSFWLNEAGRFYTAHLDDGTSVEVMGDDMVNTPSQDQHSVQSFSYTTTPTLTKSTPCTTPLFGCGRWKNAVLVKIIHAHMSSRNEKNNPAFQEIGQTYINVNEENANVNFLTTEAREAFHDETVDLVTSNGLKITDNEGTRGQYIFILCFVSTFTLVFQYLIFLSLVRNKLGCIWAHCHG